MVAVTEFRLLGPLVVRHGGTAVSVTRGNQRAVLATLLLNANQVVSLDEIAEILWAAGPPQSAVLTIRNYVRRLRQALGNPGRARIGTQPAGYLISVEAGELDLSRFEALLGSARTAARDGSWDTAAARASAALSLWRGEPLADVESDALALREVPRLAEMRLQALEARIDADLHLGRHAEVTAELQHVADAHPLREQLHAQLMLALYRCGQQGGALAAYQRARQILVEELGTEPGAQLQELHRQILAADPALATPQPPLTLTRGRAPTVPRQLPGTAHFTGREADLAALTEMLGQVGRETPGTVVISAVSGMAGVGKTALAVHWAHQAADRFPDGQLYVDLRGFDPSGASAAPAEVIRGFLEALGVPASQIPPSLEGQAGLYRSLLAGRQILIVLDNARDEQQVRPLLPASPGCLVIVTSRNQLVGLAATRGAHLLTLDVLTDSEARQMLTARLGGERAAAEPEAVGDIAVLCARLPLALAVAAARAATRPQLCLSTLAAELRDLRGRLDALDAGDPAANVRTVFSWSYQQLDPATARMFRLLGLHPGPDISSPAAASLAGTGEPEARSLLAKLARAHLITEHVPGRYTFHDLLRAYATEQAHTTDDEQTRRDATGRMLDHYLHSGDAAAQWLQPYVTPRSLPPPGPGVQPEPVTGPDQAATWLAAERPVLLAAAGLAAHTGFGAHAWQLPWALSRFLARQARWSELAAAHTTALQAATRLADQAGQACAYRGLGLARERLGAPSDGLALLRRALALHHDLDDPFGRALIHVNMAMALEARQEQARALGHARCALGLFRRAGQRAGQAIALNSVGWFHILLGDCHRGLAYCQQALTIWDELGDRSGYATWDSVGYAQCQLGHYDYAISSYQRALALTRRVHAPEAQAKVLAHLGDAHHAAGDPQQARNAWHQALTILVDLNHPDAEKVSAKLASAHDRPHASP
jgi:DNA-binding SARP family transcriptional activator